MALGNLKLKNYYKMDNEEYPDFHGDYPFGNYEESKDKCACGKACSCKKTCECKNCKCSEESKENCICKEGCCCKN